MAMYTGPCPGTHVCYSMPKYVYVYKRARECFCVSSKNISKTISYISDFWLISLLLTSRAQSNKKLHKHTCRNTETQCVKWVYERTREKGIEKRWIDSGNESERQKMCTMFKRKIFWIKDWREITKTRRIVKTSQEEIRKKETESI